MSNSAEVEGLVKLEVLIGGHEEVSVEEILRSDRKDTSSLEIEVNKKLEKDSRLLHI